jgi:FHA domain
MHSLLASVRARALVATLATLALFAFVSQPALAALEQDRAAAEPWGYLYEARTMQLFPLTAEESHIGRLAENDVVLVSPRVSRRHAVVRRTEDGVELTDVGSSNGTKLNGVELRPRFSVAVQPGDRLELADEILLFHTSLPALWADELRDRLLTRIVTLKVKLPEDEIRRSLGRQETVFAESRATVKAESGTVAVDHSIEVEANKGFPEGGGAFVGNLRARDGVLDVSLWALAAGQNMTSRRASFTNLKHVRLKVSVAENVSNGTGDGGSTGPWFPSSVLSPLFDVFPDDAEFSLQFASSLSMQEKSVALEDAAVSLYFRHELEPEETKLLVLAARSKGLWVEREMAEKGLSLTADERARLAEALGEARLWLQDAEKLGAKGGTQDEAAAVLVRAGERLQRLQNNS